MANKIADKMPGNDNSYTYAASQIYSTNNTGASAKRFVYIDKGTKLNDTLVGLFSDSLIVIGDESRAFIPSLETYIGPDIKRITALEANTAYNVVTSLNGLSKDTYLLSYTSSGEASSSAGINIKKNDDGTLNKIIGQGEGDDTEYQGIEILSYVIYNNAGTTTIVKSSEDNFGNAKSYISEYPSSFMGSYIKLDSSRINAEIIAVGNEVLSYSTNYTKNYTNTQINKLYSEILGISYIPITFDKDDGIFTTTTGTYINIVSSTNTFDLKNLDKDALDIIKPEYISYVVTNENIFVKVNPKLVDKNLEDDSVDTEHGVGDYSIPSGTKIDLNISYYDSTLSESTNEAEIKYVSYAYTFDSAIKITDNKIVIAADINNDKESEVIKLNVDNLLYTYNTASTSDLSNVTGAITTLSKVAEILDEITDGNKDGGISLAYSIADNRIDIDTLNRQVAAIINPSNPDRTDEGLNIVNSITGTQTSSDDYLPYLTLSAFGDKASQDDTYKEGNVELKLTYHLGTPITFNDNGVDIDNWKDNKNDGLVSSNILAKSFKEFGAYVWTHVNEKLDYTDSSYETSNSFVWSVNQENGKIAVIHANIDAKDELWTTNSDDRISSIGNSSLDIHSSIQTTISHDATNGNITIETNAYTMSLEEYGKVPSSDAGSYRNYLARTSDVYSYIMSLISWVDLSNLTPENTVTTQTDKSSETSDSE